MSYYGLDPTRAPKRGAEWECANCAAINDIESTHCWNCQHTTRHVNEREKD